MHVVRIVSCLCYCMINYALVLQDFLQRSSRVLERALGEKLALDVLLDYAHDEGDSGKKDQGQRLNEAMTLHEVCLINFFVGT